MKMYAFCGTHAEIPRLLLIIDKGCVKSTIISTSIQEARTCWQRGCSGNEGVTTMEASLDLPAGSIKEKKAPGGGGGAHL